MTHAPPEDAPADGRALRRGWTTGACATAAASAAAAALTGGGAFPDPVTIRLPGGTEAAFALAAATWQPGRATAAIVKDAGDDPDVTHGALVEVAVVPRPPGAGIGFEAGPGVGTVTRPGLPLPPGEPAINPVPRRMIADALAARGLPDATVTISIPGGEALAERTLNARLGIVGGLSILGTTGIVVPYSCAAWIDSIRRGIDVARAGGLSHIAASTGSVSEAAVRAHHGLPDMALIEMGDFVGGTLKYLARHPVPRVTLAGGPAKLAKLAQGRLDLHSRRAALDLGALAALAGNAHAPASLVDAIASAPTGLAAFARAKEAGFPLADRVAAAGLATAAPLIGAAGIDLEILVFDRDGILLGQARTGPPPHVAPRNRRS